MTKRIRSMVHRLGIVAMLAFVAAIRPGIAAADLSSVKAFDIPPQPVASALLKFSSQSGVQVTSSGEMLEGKQSPGVVGRFAVRTALERLLKGTDLHYDVIDPNTIAIRGLAEGSRPAASTRKGAAAGNGLPAASQRGLKEEEKSPPGAPRLQEGPDRGQEDVSAATDAGQASKDESAALEEVVVTGSRLPGLTPHERAQPVLVYTQQQIQASGQTSVSDFLNTVPQVSVGNTQAQGTETGGITGVQLHGLPNGATLVLINGRRSNTGRFSTLDLNAIPVSMIERIEVIPTGSSAIYGSDAIAGVVNIILKSDYNGAELSAKYGGAAGTRTTMATAAFGRSSARSGFEILGSFQNQSELTGTERLITSLGDLTALGGLAPFFLLRDLCNPGSVYSLTGDNLPGLNAPDAGIPPGLTGKPPISAFQSTAGHPNTSCQSAEAINSLIPEQRAGGVLINGHVKFSNSIDAFGELLYSHTSTTNHAGALLTLFGGSLGISQLPASNAFNPFGQTVGISFFSTNDPIAFDSTVESIRPVLGLRGSLFHDWYWEATVQYASEKLHVLAQSPNETAILTALASADPASALNLFSGASPGSPGLLSSLTSPNVLINDNRLSTVQGFVRGPLLDLPAGAVEVVTGAEYEKYREADVSSTSSTAPVLRRNTYAAFAEANIPVLASATDGGTGDVLALSLAGRYDHSDDFGGKATGQSGIEWRPFKALLVRGTYETAYRAPILNDLDGLSTTSPFTVTDPQRDNEEYQATAHFGGNPRLRPETALSHTLGVVWSSPALEGFEAGVTQWSIKYSNFISSVDPATVLEFPQLFPSYLVVRAPATSQDIQRGVPGVITDISATNVNFGGIDLAGVDADVRYSLGSSLGVFSTELAASETYRYRVNITPALPVQNAVSQFLAEPGYSPRWKGIASVGWNRGGYSAALTGRYVGSYNDTTDFGGVQPHDIGNFWLFDLNLRWDIGESLANAAPWVRGIELSLGAVNVLNTLPKVSYQPAGYDSTQGDIRGRFIYGQVTATFGK